MTDHKFVPSPLSTSLRLLVASRSLGDQLPRTFHGYPTNFTPPDPEDSGTQLLQAADTGPINHRVDILTVPGFWLDYLNFDIDLEIEAVDWLTFPEQKLRPLVPGAVFHDEVGLQAVRERFAHYPHEVWLYLLAAGWTRLGQEEHLMGRAGYVGDEMGAALIGARLVRDVMRLCFLMEQQYAPYPKWFGTAFKQLSHAASLAPVLQQALSAGSWQERDEHLSRAYEYLAAWHNEMFAGSIDRTGDLDSEWGADAGDQPAGEKQQDPAPGCVVLRCGISW